MLPNEIKNKIFKKACFSEIEEKFPINYIFTHGTNSISFSDKELKNNKDLCIRKLSDFVINKIFECKMIFHTKFTKMMGNKTVFSNEINLINDYDFKKYFGKCPKSPLESYLWIMTNYILPN